MSTILRPDRFEKNYFGNGSDGDVVIASNVLWASSTGVDDTGVAIMNAENLTIEAGFTLSPANRVRCFLIYCKGDVVVNGTLSVSAMGAAGIPVEDNVIFRKATGSGMLTSGNPFSHFPEEMLKGGSNIVRLGAPLVGGSAGLGATTHHGQAGSAGTYGQTGGGGSGGGGINQTPTYINNGNSGAAGTAWAGGSAGGGGHHGTDGFGGTDAIFGCAGGTGGSANGGGLRANAGGGAGIPGGVAGSGPGSAGNGETGAGGVLIICARGNVIINASGKIESNGKRGGNGGNVGTHQMTGGAGGSSGGGSISIAFGGTYTNVGMVQCIGGASNTTTYTQNGGWGFNQVAGYGGAGGDGSVLVFQIDA